MGFFSLAHAAESQILQTNAVTMEDHGTLQLLTQKDWTLTRTNTQLNGKPLSIELHSASNTIAMQMTIYWDGMNEKMRKLTDADMELIVSNVATRQYLPISVEKKFVLEQLKGPEMTGTFARFTDAGWVPVKKNEFRNLATGMFRCGNLWGNFDLLTNDKDGPLFKQGVKVLESLHREP